MGYVDYRKEQCFLYLIKDLKLLPIFENKIWGPMMYELKGL